MGKTLKTLKRELLADDGVRKAYEAQESEFALARELIAARARAKLTQAEVARRMGTTQSAIARLESGVQLPSIRTLMRFAAATGTRPVVRLVPARKTARRKEVRFA